MRTTWPSTKSSRTSPPRKTGAITRITESALQAPGGRRESAAGRIRLSRREDNQHGAMKIFSRTLLKPATVVCLVLPACIGFVETASAHDPGLSNVAVKLKGSRLEAVATFARKDIEGLLDSSAAQATERGPERGRLQELAQGILAL